MNDKTKKKIDSLCGELSTQGEPNLALQLRLLLYNGREDSNLVENRVSQNFVGLIALEELECLREAIKQIKETECQQFISFEKLNDLVEILQNRLVQRYSKIAG
jgi:hypothetical protein